MTLPIGEQLSPDSYTPVLPQSPLREGQSGSDIQATAELMRSEFTEMVSRTPSTSDREKILTDFSQRLSKAGFSEAQQLELLVWANNTALPQQPIAAKQLDKGHWQLRMVFIDPE